jgi:hypothetical protein
MVPGLTVTMALAAARLSGVTNTFPALAEFDLVFPRNNETYGPTALFPFVFAIQNPDLAFSLDPGLVEINLWNVTNWSAPGYGLSVFLGEDWNISRSGVYYAYTVFRSMFYLTNGSATPFLLDWSLSISNCSRQQPGAAVQLSRNVPLHSGHINFFIQQGGQEIDLVAGRSAPACTNTSHFAFNITNTLDAGQAYDPGTPNLTTCAVLSDTQPTPFGNPCAAQLDSAAASSISSVITAHECLGSLWTPLVSCPPKPTASSFAVSRQRGPGVLRRAAVLVGVVIAYLAV